MSLQLCRDFIRSVAHSGQAIVLASFVGCLPALSGPAAPQPVEEVRPLIGTGGHGHTYPGATMPFGFVQLSPDTRLQTDPWNYDVWDGCSGYHYSDTKLFGFSHTHLSGTGCPDLGDLLLLPIVGNLGAEPLTSERFRAPFHHENELAQPGYYRVLLEKPDILAELTVTERTGLHRYTFPDSEQSHVLIDLVHGLKNKPTEANLKIESDTRLTGFRRSEGWAKDKILFFVIEASQPFAGFGLEAEGKRLAAGQTEASGKQLRGHLDFKTTADKPVVLRVGLSVVSLDGAQKNLQAEVGGKGFDAVRDEARSVWNGHLSAIQIESTDANFRQTFYTALFHTMTAPTLYNDADGAYRGADRQIHTATNFQFYSTFSLWDTFRAEHPLLTLVQPRRVDDFVQSLLAAYQQSPSNSLPMWPLAACETWCMIGYHSVSVIAEAYAKGFRGFDAELAYRAMRTTAMDARFHQDKYQKLGYVPTVAGDRTEATSRTLEFSYDDWCIAQMARALGKTDDAALFSQRAQNYRNVFDAESKLFRGKLANGKFREPFNPKAINFDDFTEANAWQYAFAVPHDVPGMIQLYGGEKSFVARLDALFNEDSDVAEHTVDISGLVGQYAHGNEPCHHVAYLYALAGAQHKAARRVRHIAQWLYDNTPAGICGNDDCGQTSAWFVFSALGFYPVNPVDGRYVFGSPMVEKAVIQLDPKYHPGKTFTVLAHKVSKQNLYIKSAKLNGQKLERPWITHDEIINGGTLEFEMDIVPHKLCEAARE